MAGEAPTAVIAESGSPMAEKLGKVGVENTDPPILALKQAIAAQGNSNYKTIGATIPKGSRTATGVGNSFTKDLTAYFTAGFTQASAVALVNFKDLEPGGDGSGNPNPIPSEPTYSNCNVVQGVLQGGSGVTRFDTVCYGSNTGAGPPWTNQIVADRSIDVCDLSGTTAIAVLPFGGTLTRGWNDSDLRYLYNDSTLCPSDYDSTNLRCNRKVGSTFGILTMNSVTVDQRQCSYARYSSGAYQNTTFPQAAYNVCCRVTPPS